AQVRLAADQADLLDAEVGHLVDEIETLLGRQLVRTIAPGARAAVPAGEVARERDLPDRVDRPVLLVLVARLEQGQPALGGGRRGSDRQARPRPWRAPQRIALLRRERIGAPPVVVLHG